jgi:hypothetical protein
VRDQLNRGVVPEGVNLHCLAGLIKVCCTVYTIPFSFLTFNGILLHYVRFYFLNNLSCVGPSNMI